MSCGSVPVGTARPALTLCLRSG